MSHTSLCWPQKSISPLAGIIIMAMIIFSEQAESETKPPLLILDTDISSDVDDVGAVALLHGLANQGKVRILAMMGSSGDPWSVPCLDAINTWFGRPNIPIGMVKGNNVRHVSKYSQKIAQQFPHDSQTGAEAQDAVDLYRHILAHQEDKSVILVTVGYLTNLRNLLQSKPDEHSPLDGKTLVQQKVQRLVAMGGQYPSGREWNFHQDPTASAYVVKHWPTPIVFSGFEVGKDVLTGAGLRHKNLDPQPVQQSYMLYNGLTDRPSWDQVTVYYAVITANGQQTDLWSSIQGKNSVQEDGSNLWQNTTEASQHSYLVQNGPTETITDLIEQLMLSKNISPE